MGSACQKIWGGNTVSFIIVNWNGEEFLEKCLNSIFSSDGQKEVIVIDNNSQDNSLKIIEKFPVKLIKNTENLGYSRAINQGMKASKGDIIVFLSPSTYVAEDFIYKLTEFFSTYDTADAVGFKVIDKNNRVYPSVRGFPDFWGLLFTVFGLAKIFPQNRIFGKWRQLYFDYAHTGEADQPMGAAFAVKKELLNTLNGMDERFSLYFSDVDLCKRIKKNGGKIFYTPKIIVSHLEGGMTKKMGIKRIRIMHRDMLRYYRKYSRLPVFLLSSFLIIISGEIRIFAQRIKNWGRGLTL